MDQDKLSYFISRYKTLDGDDLAELHSRRGMLADEAILALDTVLSEKGINKDILASYSEKSSEIESPSEAELAHRQGDMKKEASPHINKKIRMLRPALIASLFGFGWGISTTIKPQEASYGPGYFVLCMAVGVIYSVTAFLIVFAWQGIRRNLKKPREDGTPKKSKPGLFTAIVSDEDALAAIRVYGWLIVAMSGIGFAIGLFAGDIGVGILDAVIVIGFAAIVLRLKSRVAAVGLLLLSVVSAFATGHNRFFGGEGGANLFMALLILWASVRLVIATFQLQSIRTSEPKVASPESVATQATARSSHQNSSTETRHGK